MVLLGRLIEPFLSGEAKRSKVRSLGFLYKLTNLI
jgi:hypothetical protein